MVLREIPNKYLDPDGNSDRENSLVYGFLNFFLGKQGADKITDFPNADGFLKVGDRIMVASLTVPADLIGEGADWVEMAAVTSGNATVAGISALIGKMADTASLSGKLYMALRTGEAKDWGAFFEKGVSVGFKLTAAWSIERKSKQFEIHIGLNGGYYQLGRRGRLNDVQGLREKIMQDLSPLIGAKMAERFSEQIVGSINEKLTEAEKSQ